MPIPDNPQAVLEAAPDRAIFVLIALGADHPDTVATRRALAELAAEGDGPPAAG